MSLVKTNENCIGCNKCIKACSSMGANVAAEKGRGNIIDVDPDKCIACGACLDVCEHGAREYIDDVDRFFEDLKRGTRISVLIAPAFLANYPNEYEKYFVTKNKFDYYDLMNNYDNFGNEENGNQKYYDKIWKK